MTMGSVFTETDIGGDEERRKAFTQFTNGKDDRAVNDVCGVAPFILLVESILFSKKNKMK